MFNLNPLGNPDALWQHSVMILISAIIGYVIGHLGSKQTTHELKKKLFQLNRDIKNCQSKKTGSDITKAATHSVEIKETTEIKTGSDDLKIITGIDAKIEEILHSEKIYTFLELSLINTSRLNEILQHSEPDHLTNNSNTWPQQAKLASNQLWDELTELQNKINKSQD